MVLRCPTCGFVNQMADAETAFCPNCGNPYITAAIGNDAMVAAAPSYVPAASYAPFPARTPYPTQVPTSVTPRLKGRGLVQASPDADQS